MNKGAQPLLRLFLLILGILVGFVAGKYLPYKDDRKITVKAAKSKIEAYIKSTGVQGVTIDSVEDTDPWVYIVNGNSQGQKFVFHMTKDGTKLFQGTLDLNSTPQQDVQGAAVETPSEKTEKPKVELFVMSQCPYGTQMEKGILPVLATLGDKIDFELKFVNYAMHGETEVREQMQQYCIQKQGLDKLKSYLSCFLKEGDSESCVNQGGINNTELASCIQSTDTQYNIMEKFNDQSTWVGGRYPPFDIYKEDVERLGVQGSPSLAINGELISAGRDPASILSVICSAFTNAPAECNTELSSETYASGFGFEVSDSNSNASCN